MLGLGNIGALAGKPVMEGKAVLFKKFAGIDVFDIEVNEADPDRFCDVVAALEPTFGAINLEDIKAPECFEIEAKLRARMKIPVFHDDQHGTAITVAAAVRNGLLLQGKTLAGVPPRHFRRRRRGDGLRRSAGGRWGCGRRTSRSPTSRAWSMRGAPAWTRAWAATRARPRRARSTRCSTAPTFFSASRHRDVLKAEWLGKLAPKPLILALANPDPEIAPEAVRAARPDAIVATGRSDYANQVNNVLCFPFIFRGALDVGARTIDEPMQLAAVEAIAELARIEASEVVVAAYGGAAPTFGPDYIIPKPFDPRLILHIAPAVARAAMASGAATRPIADFVAYKRELERSVFRTGQLMRPVFEAARAAPMRIVYAEGEDARVLRAVQTALDEQMALPILLGRRSVIAARVRELGPAHGPGERPCACSTRRPTRTCSRR